MSIEAWGWTPPVRALLTAGALAASLGLAALADPDRGATGPPIPLALDVNTAPRGVLLALPRIGPALAGRILEARDRAPFRSAEEFDARVKGIGPATMTGLRPFLSWAP